MKHQAYNTFSGEIITTTNGNNLKRLVARHNRFERVCASSEMVLKIYSKYIRSWKFCHDGRFTKEVF
jgi:hypothetical protein